MPLRARRAGRPPSDAPESPAGLLVRLRGLRPSLSPAEDRVAECVLADARAAAAMTISELAQAAHTSETTVLRFCKRLGMPGYPELRLALAAESAQPRSLAASDSDINETDSIDDIVSKVAYADASAVEETAHQLDQGSLSAAADAISGATRVDLYGIGASGIVGIDAQQKLHRVGISHSGTTKETIEALVKARSRGATTIAITNFPLSRLAATADLVLTTAARETSLRSGATASRIAALTVVDCLYIAVAHRDLNRARRAVAETREAVASHHV